METIIAYLESCEEYIKRIMDNRVMGGIMELERQLQKMSHGDGNNTRFLRLLQQFEDLRLETESIESDYRKILLALSKLKDRLKEGPITTDLIELIKEVLASIEDIKSRFIACRGKITAILQECRRFSDSDGYRGEQTI